MARRRRLRLVTDSDDDVNANIGSDRLCTRRNLNGPAMKCSTRLWSDRYRPRRSGDLCVSTKKVNELRTWLNEGKGMLICIGPPGAGKTTALEVLAAELGYYLIRWSDPITLASHYASIREQTGSWAGGDLGVDCDQPRMKSFTDFLFRSRRYRSLAADSNVAKQLIVIEELPYLGRPDDLKQFRCSCLKACRLSRSPIAFVLTSTHENNNDAERIFGKPLLSENGVRLLNFNAVTTTAMLKALRRIIDSESLVIGEDVLDETITSSNGDIRNAIHQLQLEQSGKMSTMTNSMLRDQTLSIFHALGKILYAKPDMDEPEGIIATSTLNDTLFAQYLHENCLDFITESIELQRDVVSSFSVVDVICQHMPWQNDRYFPSYASSIASRAYIVAKRASESNRTQWKPIRAPYERHVQSQTALIRTLAQQSHSFFELDDKLCWTLPYLCMMQNRRHDDVPDELFQRIRSYSAGGQQRLDFARKRVSSESLDPSILETVFDDWDAVCVAEIK